MKVVFVSNFLNHHQIPFCNKMLSLCDEFFFVATEADASQGYQKSFQAEYVVNYAKDKDRADSLILESDAVIFGACPNELIELRMNENKLSFLYSERFFKKGIWRRFIPSTRKKVFDRVIKYKDKNMLVLCASAYLPYDLSLMGFPKEKCLKWGYFPDTQLEAKTEEKAQGSILWAGRMLDWKHPEIPVFVAQKLKADGYDFKMDIVGEGAELERVKALAEAKDVMDKITFRGSLSHNDLLLEMRKRQMFMFTSDRYEGWGAVLNEAMSSRCVPVASDAIGAVPYLIDDGKNGLVFKSCNINDAYKKVKMLLDDQNMRETMSEKAHSTIFNEWNADIAAERLVSVIKDTTFRYESGPCSASKVIKG